jgi:hypothetical protein
MALQPAFFTGPPPPVVRPTLLPNNNVVYGINPDMSRWIQNLWNWTVKFGNNADGAASFSGSISIGTSPNWFKADASGIWLGGATFAAATFSVSMAGAVSASNVTITGGDITTTGHVNATGGYSVGGGIYAISGTPSATDGGGGLFAGKGIYDALHALAQSGCSGDALYAANSGTGYAGRFIGNASKAAVFISQGSGQYAIDTTGGVGQFNGVATGNLVSGGALGTPSSGTLTNCTFPTLNQNTTGSAATLTTARNIGGTSFNGSASIDCIQTKHAGDNSICSFTGSPGATTYPLAYTVGKSASGGAIPALNRNADDGGTMGWYWLKVWSGSQFIYMPYMA